MLSFLIFTSYCTKKGRHIRDSLLGILPYNEMVHPNGEFGLGFHI